MVSVNFRLNYGIKKEDIFIFLKNIDYEHIGTNNSSIKVEDEYLNTDIFVRNTKNGRYHLHLAFGKKYSGSEEYPQLKVFLHFDIKKVIKGKEKHIHDKNEERNMKEIYKIEEKIIKAKIGFLEMKDKMCAHTTIDLKDKNKLLEILQTDFKKYDKGKYRKKYNSSQCTIALYEQEKFIHIICVYANIVGVDHELIRFKAISKLKNIIQKITSDSIKIV
ncbi:hypothetical protein ES705_25599 [subsurface metagenome]